MTITVHTDNGSGFAILDGSGKPSAPKRHYGLSSMRAQAREAILTAADKHELIFLERLQKLVEAHGPDGIIVRNDFDACLLAVLIDVLREAQGLDL